MKQIKLFSLLAAVLMSAGMLAQTDWSNTSSLPSSAGSYRLTVDVTLSSTWNVPSGTTTLDLNGHTIRQTSSSSGVISVDGRTLIINDSQGTGVITGGREGSRPYSRWALKFGAAIMIRNGRVTLNGGTITGCSTTEIADGGAVSLSYSSTFIMNGGAIKDNQAMGIRFREFESGYASTFIMTGGEISNNKYSGVDGISTMTISGGTIYGNDTNGGGKKDVNIGANSTFNLSGNPTIAYAVIGTGAHMNITDVLTGSIGVLKTTPGVFTSGLSGRGDASNFTSRVDNGSIMFSASDEAMLVTPMVITAREDPQNAGDYYTTFYDSSIKYELPEGVEAYVAERDEAHLQLTRIAVGGQVIPANTGVILKADNASFTLMPPDATPVTTGTNHLLGVDASTSAPANCYVLSGHSSDNAIQGIGFYQFSGTLGARKAYLLVPSGSGAPARLRFVFNEENAATSTESIQQSAINSQKVIENGQLIIIRNGVRYNAQGQMVK